MALSEGLIGEVVYELLRRAVIRIPRDVLRALEDAYMKEEEPLAKSQLKVILENVKMAEERELPVCQDTGIPLFFIELGSRIRVKGDLKEGVYRGVERATRMIPLRSNVIHPFTKENPGTNVGWCLPHIHLELKSGSSDLRVIAAPKGLGSEAKTTLYYVASNEPMIEAVSFCVLDAVKEASGEPCPPYILGVGVGGTGELAVLNSKKASLKRIGSRNLDPDLAKLELRLLDTVNRTGIGPMGLGGSTTALDVHVEVCGSHTAATPVAVSFQCWAARRAEAVIKPNGDVEYPEP
ncbi:MAG: fumarate hydratase [Candidatus Bathyarchaeia archaeon]